MKTVTETETVEVTVPPGEPGAIEASCFWRNGEADFCENSWEDPNGEWYMDTDSQDRVVVYNHQEEVLGYVREMVDGGWRAVVLRCLDNPPPAWKQGCGYVRNGKFVSASEHVYYVFKGGQRIGIARGRNAFAVAVLKLVMEW
jgi:hypothetical protein